MRDLKVAGEGELAAFIARQRELLKHEREAEIERTSLLLSNCSQKLLEQKGLALGSLGIANIGIGLGGKSLVELERPSAYHTSPLFPPHSLRPGDLARIEENMSSNATTKKSAKSAKKGPTESSSKAGKSQAVEGVVYKVSDTRITIVVDPSTPGADDLDLPDKCRIVKLANSVTYDRMDKAMVTLEKLVLSTSLPEAGKTRQQRTKLIEVLLCMSPPSDPVYPNNLKFFDEALNSSQREAVKFALAAPEVACIHGPPGTGKTYTLIEIIRQITAVTVNSRPQRVLVCGASNLSVDNILERLLALPETAKAASLTATRVGHPARVIANDDVLGATLEARAGRSDQAALAKDVKDELEAALAVLSGKGKGAKGKAPRGAERRKMWDEVKALRKEYRQREGTVVQTVLGNSQVVVATCHSSGGRQLWSEEFDVVIIDEATQAMEPVCWVPIFKAKKLILAGDPMQLPPTVLSVGIKNKSNKAVSTSAKQVSKIESVAETVSVHSDDSEYGDLAMDSSEEEDATEAPATPEAKKRPAAKRFAQLVPPRSLETTLFDRLEKTYGPGIKKMLKVQYRMHSDIASFPSKVMYSNRLKSHDTVAKRLLRDLPNANALSEEEAKELLGTPIVFFDTAGCEYFERLDGDNDEGSRCNENEAMVVKKWVESLVETGIFPSQIAVITPYQAQVTLLAGLLRPQYGAELEIGSVDGMQGREKDAVVISLVRSNDKREVGFLKEKRRLNVAMTRAKRSLCIVGDSETVKHGSAFLKRWMTWLESNADVRYAGPE